MKQPKKLAIRNKEIVRQFNMGRSLAEIAILFDVTPRTIQRTLNKRLGSLRGRGTKGKSEEHRLMNLRQLIIDIMKSHGRDFTHCELCGCTIPNGRFDLHHTKYEGATLADLRIVCRACNLKYENTFLL